METLCVVNKKSARKIKGIRLAQKNARKYYQEKFFSRTSNVPRMKLRKFVNLNRTEYKNLSGMELPVKPAAFKGTKEELVEAIKKAGLTGRSGNGFLVWRKLKAMKKGGTLIINAVECDPGLVTDSWIYKNRLTQIQDGAEIIKKALGMKKVVLATKEPLRPAEGIEQVKVPDRFPLGYENYLVQHLLGIGLKEGELPQERGVLVMNLQTVLAVYEIFKNEELAKYRYLTVSNLETAQASAVHVRIGEDIEEIAEKCFSKSAMKGKHLYTGGGAFSSHEAVKGERVTDRTGYIALGQAPDYEEAGSCRKCGACTKNCPAGVSVAQLVQFVEQNGKKDGKKCKQFHPENCIGCGNCTYGCMAGKDVREVVAWAKKELS